jgi:two-component system chemotaxis response regulator CheB
MIQTLIVEDSPVVQEMLKYILSSDPEITVIGTARNGEEALDFISRKKPDVVTMDINMPKMDGYTATRRIMETCPVPIVVVSASLEPEEVNKAWRAIEAGAVAALEKPRGLGSREHSDDAEKLIQTVKLMSQVKVVRRWAHVRRPQPVVSAPVMVRPDLTGQDLEVVAIGASTGGPPVLSTILSGLPEDFPAAVLVVQHITPGFCEGFVHWLNQLSTLEVRAAVHGERALPGRVYVAPDGFHMRIETGNTLSLTTDGPENGLRPAVSYLFRSVARVVGRKAVGVLVTGMGKDGAAELKLMRDSGALTIAQDEDSSVVHGMPGEAIRLGAAKHILSPEGICELLASLVGSRRP